MMILRKQFDRAYDKYTYEIGHYNPNGEFDVLCRSDVFQHACNLLSHLNGGDLPTAQMNRDYVLREEKVKVQNRLKLSSIEPDDNVPF